MRQTRPVLSGLTQQDPLRFWLTGPGCLHHGIPTQWVGTPSPVEGRASPTCKRVVLFLNDRRSLFQHS